MRVLEVGGVGGGGGGCRWWRGGGGGNSARGGDALQVEPLKPNTEQIFGSFVEKGGGISLGVSWSFAVELNEKTRGRGIKCKPKIASSSYIHLSKVLIRRRVCMRRYAAGNACERTSLVGRSVQLFGLESDASLSCACLEGSNLVRK
jgi:hypothetical protein